ncbi:MAG: ATP-binding cassette domain-containing protein, partial [Clostridia bacterium]|nr:ATP-binding cassette domain-containing protein [Clostridia bacterium]
CENLGFPPEEIRRRVDSALEAVGMSKYKKHAPHLLSGGQKQRIAIAGVIAISPEVIVLDEPTAMLDPTGRAEVMKTITELNRKYNITIVLITHNMDEAVCADRVVVMDDGSIIIDDVQKKVFSKVQMLMYIGLDVPQVTDLAHYLRGKGVDIAADVLHVDECVEELLRICQ